MFPQVKAVEGVRGWRRKAQVVGVFGESDVRREVCADLEARCAASLGGRWWAYVWDGLIVESRYGAPVFGVQGALRTGLRGRSGAGARVGLGRS